ncbi:MAG TPA: tRNA (guanosine(37)-N1)-methyltransferase TrmD [candidate division Zixibacteria bacterium]|nr:tRNA (guanosine(37)-N1)-methyltransferase TrmD [candidate division Zixibacteria bacterium]HEQ99568.1 tRNA (guanosine(37)-N1)-methyltransferase TrmD [candidate division Zixibacteria bacterium]
MRIEVLTIFPEIFDSPIKSSLLGKARDAGLLEINVSDIRDFSTDKHRTVDDTPFGGGAGMVMKAEPIDRALQQIRENLTDPRLLLTSASGKKFDQKMANELSREESIIIICGRYKGVDERILELHPIEEVSIGDYVLSGGEAAALVMIEAVARLVPGYMGKIEAGEDDAFAWGILGFPNYTHPQEYKGLKVPDVLVSGHHAKIERYRRYSALKKTLQNRPELLETIELSDIDKKLLDEIKK